MSFANKKHQGVIIIVVLWIIVISLVMVTILASNVRLSVATIFHQQNALQTKANVMAALNLAKMEILIQKNNSRNRLNRKNNTHSFNGKAVKLSYPYETGMVVQIHDLSGLINIAHISRKKFQLILEKQVNLNELDLSVDSLLDAWQDWIDSDDLNRLHGAESYYYQQKQVAYEPRNAPLETPDELKLIKGFDVIFKGIDLSSVFSTQGQASTINPNISSRETLLLIPGITEILADEIISRRAEYPFQSISEFHTLFSIDEINKIKPWFSLRNSNLFAIIIYPKELENNAGLNANKSREIYAYKELVQYKGLNQLPQTLMVYPMSKIKVYTPISNN